MGGTMKLKPLALGLEAAMVGFLLDALIYSMMVIHWFYTMLALNLLLHALTVGRTAQLAKRKMGAGAQPIQRTRSARAT